MSLAHGVIPVAFEGEGGANAYEHALAALHPDERKRLGAWYTPPALCEFVLDLALEPALAAAAAAADPEAALLDLRVCDPACGTGHFLLAAARRIAVRLAAARGLPVTDALTREVVYRHCLVGIDVDAAALRVAAARLASAAGEPAASAGIAARNLYLADALLETPDVGRVDVVVGNPPFLTRLRRLTAGDDATAARLRDRFGAAAHGYADRSGLFLLLGCDLASPGGHLAMVVPRSVLAGHDARFLRAELLDRATITGVWAARTRMFSAAVHVCVLAFRTGRAAAEVCPVRAVGADFAALPTRRFRTAALRGRESWAPLLEDTHDVPQVALQGSGRLGDIAGATADFRDQYYGVLPHLRDVAAADEASFPRLVTVGLVDPAVNRWGVRPARIGGRDLLHPRVDEAALPERLRRWACARLVPKVLLATQTRVLEAVVDEAGAWLPAVPLISVLAQPADLWHVEAVLSAPPVSALMHRRHAGAGFSPGVLRLRAADVLDVPLPRDRAAWDTASATLQAAPPGDRDALLRCGAAMCEAYGAGEDVFAWWVRTLPANSSYSRRYSAARRAGIEAASSASAIAP